MNYLNNNFNELKQDIFNKVEKSGLHLDSLDMLDELHTMYINSDFSELSKNDIEKTFNSSINKLNNTLKLKKQLNNDNKKDIVEKCFEANDCNYSDMLENATLEDCKKIISLCIEFTFSSLN